jgi:hypothetical protein
MICAWHNIWTLSMRLSLMRNVQLMKNKIYIFRVYHIRIIAKKNWFTRHETDRFLNNHCQEYVRAYLSIHDCLSFLHEVMIGNHWTKTFFTRLWSAIIGTKQPKVNNGKDDKHAHRFADFYLLGTYFDLKHAWIA